MHDVKRYKSIGISKHRLYELRYFCLQYRQWRHKLLHGATGIEKMVCEQNIAMIDSVADEAGEAIAEWLLRAVTTEGLSAEKLIANGMPCGKDYFYERRRRFFELLDREKNRTQGTSG